MFARDFALDHFLDQYLPLIKAIAVSGGCSHFLFLSSPLLVHNQPLRRAPYKTESIICPLQISRLTTVSSREAQIVGRLKKPLEHSCQ